MIETKPQRRPGYQFCERHQMEFRQYCLGCVADSIFCGDELEDEADPLKTDEAEGTGMDETKAVLGPMAFVEHRDKIVEDLIAVREILDKLIEDVKVGDLAAFERFWIRGGTEEGDAKILYLRQLLVLRFVNRVKQVAGAEPDEEG